MLLVVIRDAASYNYNMPPTPIAGATKSTHSHITEIHTGHQDNPPRLKRSWQEGDLNSKKLLATLDLEVERLVEIPTRFLLLDVSTYSKESYAECRAAEHSRL